MADPHRARNRIVLFALLCTMPALVSLHAFTPWLHRPYDAANRLLWAEDVSGRTTYTLDANGNQTSIEELSGDITTST